MDITMAYRYYVVEFSDPPNKDFDQYVCIPDSWIQLREIVDQVVVAKYPVEKSSITKKRVKKGETCSDDWSIYVADVKYGTDSYGAAKKYIKKLKKKRNHLLSQKINKSQVSVAPSISNVVSVSEQLPLSNPKKRTRNKQTSVAETIDSTIKVTKQTGVSCKSFNDRQLSTTWEKDLGETKATRKKCSEKLNKTNSMEYNDDPGGETENESCANHDRPELMNESSDPIVISEQISGTCNLDSVKKQMLDHIHNANINNRKLLQKLMSFIDKYKYIESYDLIDITSTHTISPVIEEKKCEEEIKKQRHLPKRTQAEIGEIKRKEAERDEEKEDNHHDDDDDDYPKRKQFRSRKLILPPDYDENDSKWTLKYREHAPGLVELIDHTGVYINAVKLINCKRLAKNCKSLARMLLVEIFTESALRTCSLTGARAKSFDMDGSHVRPGLDENARTILLCYVEEYAKSQNWPNTGTQTILNSIRNKMQEIRFKHNQ